MSSLPKQVDPDDVTDISLLMLGDKGTGKTRLATRYAFDNAVDTKFQSQRNSMAHKDIHLDQQYIHLTINDFPGGACKAPANSNLADQPNHNISGDPEPPLSGEDKSRPKLDDVTTGGITSIPEYRVASPLNLGTDFIFASFQGDYRRSLIQRSDAVMLVFNPSDRKTFTWIRDTVYGEIAECSQKKYLGKRVARLLDGLTGTKAGQTSRSNTKNSPLSARTSRLSDLSSASTLNVAGGGNTRHGDGGKRSSRSIKELPATPSNTTVSSPQETTAQSHTTSQDDLRITPATPTESDSPHTAPGKPSLSVDSNLGFNEGGSLEVDPDYPVVLVGACADRLEEYGGDQRREVSIEEVTALARRFGPATGYVEVSALLDENVEAAFTTIVRHVMQIWDSQDDREGTRGQMTRQRSKHPHASPSHGKVFRKRLRKRLLSCFGSHPPSGPAESIQANMCSGKDSQTLTIRCSPSGAGRRSQVPPPTHQAQGRSGSKAPILREINPLPSLTLDDIDLSDSRLGPLIPSSAQTPHGNIREAPSTGSGDSPRMFAASNITASTSTAPSARSPRKPNAHRPRNDQRERRSRLEKLSLEDEAVIRMGHVPYHHVKISSPSGSTGRKNDNKQRAAPGGKEPQARGLAPLAGVPSVGQISRQRSARRTKSDRALRAHLQEHGFI
ncbi:hypothetical protein MKZ38_009579 [Zalerion maritima]|uniref:Uncharacterized protein n=1 Tax=Zalerion maritima TaxID=339359 RepID=A0AAD5WV04_9PEZI|nr:hypothetical protein MKZ38_009579 [Zalerion maritima]